MTVKWGSPHTIRCPSKANTVLTTASAFEPESPSSDMPGAEANPCATSCELTYCRVAGAGSAMDEVSRESEESTGDEANWTAQCNCFLLGPAAGVCA